MENASAMEKVNAFPRWKLEEYKSQRTEESNTDLRGYLYLVALARLEHEVSDLSS